jgi:hypothetical protein
MKVTTSQYHLSQRGMRKFCNKKEVRKKVLSQRVTLPWKQNGWLSYKGLSAAVLVPASQHLLTSLSSRATAHSILGGPSRSRDGGRHWKEGILEVLFYEVPFLQVPQMTGKTHLYRVRASCRRGGLRSSGLLLTYPLETLKGMMSVLGGEPQGHPAAGPQSWQTRALEGFQSIQRTGKPKLGPMDKVWMCDLANRANGGPRSSF